MASAARGPNSLGSQVIPGLVGPSLEFAPTGPDCGPGQAGSFGDDARAAASQGFSLTGGPLTAQSLSHQRMELVIFGPHGFYSQGLIHTIIRVQDPCQTTAQTFKLFFDSSLARNHGGDENASKDMNKYVGSVDRLKNTFHAAVLSVHHTGKDATKRGRGHTSLPAACDTIIELIPERVVDDVVQSVTVRCEKLKDAAEFKKYMLEKKEVVFGEGRNDKSLVLSPSAHEPTRPMDKKQEAAEKKRRARLYLATEVFACCPASEGEAASKKEIIGKVQDWADRKSDLDPSRDWSVGVNKISETIDWLTRRGHLARTMAKNSNHARFYKTTAHVDFFNLYGGEPTDEEVISRVREMAEPSN